jgi:hypothetical protein
MKLEDLMKQGDEFLSTRLMPSEPDWQSLHTETPDDTMPGEGPNEDDVEDPIANRDAVPHSAPAWMDALSEDLQPLGKALEGAMNAGDEAAVRGALKKLSERMPEFIETPMFEDYLTSQAVKWLDDEPKS